MARDQNPGYLLRTARAAIEGLKKSLPPKIQYLGIDGRRFSVKDLIGKLQSYVDKSQREIDTDRAHDAALRARIEEDPRFTLFLRQVGDTLRNAVGNNEAVRKFGFEPTRKRRKPTAAEDQERVRKMRATRKARHTMGKKQKKGIKGTPPEAPPAGH